MVRRRRSLDPGRLFPAVVLQRIPGASPNRSRWSIPTLSPMSIELSSWVSPSQGSSSPKALPPIPPLLCAGVWVLSQPVPPALISELDFCPPDAARSIRTFPRDLSSELSLRSFSQGRLSSAALRGLYLQIPCPLPRHDHRSQCWLLGLPM